MRSTIWIFIIWSLYLISSFLNQKKILQLPPIISWLLIIIIGLCLIMITINARRNNITYGIYGGDRIGTIEIIMVFIFLILNQRIYEWLRNRSCFNPIKLGYDIFISIILGGLSVYIVWYCVFRDSHSFDELREHTERVRELGYYFLVAVSMLIGASFEKIVKRKEIFDIIIIGYITFAIMLVPFPNWHRREWTYVYDPDSHGWIPREWRRTRWERGSICIRYLSIVSAFRYFLTALIFYKK